RVLPVLPKPADAEWAAVLHGDGIGLFGLLSLDRLPFEEAIDRQYAPPLAISLPKRRECPDGLRTSPQCGWRKCYRQRPPQGKYPPRGRCRNGPQGIVVRADPQIAACA